MWNLFRRELRIKSSRSGMTDRRMKLEDQIRLDNNKMQHAGSKWPRSLLRQLEAIKTLAGKCASSSSSRDKLKFNNRTLIALQQEFNNGSKLRESG